MIETINVAYVQVSVLLRYKATYLSAYEVHTSSVLLPSPPLSV